MTLKQGCKLLSALENHQSIHKNYPSIHKMMSEAPNLEFLFEKPFAEESFVFDIVKEVNFKSLKQDFLKAHP